MFKKILAFLFLLVVLVPSLSKATLPLIDGRKEGTTYWENQPFRQMGYGDSLIVRKGSNNDALEIWVSDQLSWSRIRAMVDTLAITPAGGIMYFMPGTYLVPDNQPLQPATGVSLVGVSRGPNFAELRLTSTIAAQRIISLTNDQDNITIKNLVLNGNISSGWGTANRYGVVINTTTGSNDDILIENCRFRQFTHAIRVESGAFCYNLRILNNEIVGNTLEDEAANCGIFVHEGSTSYYTKIIDNVIYGNNYTTGTPPYNDGWGIYFGGRRSIISQNSIHDFRSSNGGGIGIFLVAGSEYNVVSNNTFHTVYGDNISVRGAHTLIEGNLSQNSQDQGIVVEDTNYAQVTGNYIYNSQTTGIRIINGTDISITNNYVDVAGQKSGIGDDYKALYSIVNLNSAASGNSSTEEISNVLFTGNFGKVTSGTTKYGLLIDDTDEPTDTLEDIYVADNYFTPENIDTLYAGAYFPSEVVSFGEGFPLYPYCVFKDATLGYVGLPDDDISDEKAMQRWIDLSSANRMVAILGSPGEFFVTDVCSLRNNTFIDGKGEGMIQVATGITGAQWGGIQNYHGFLFAEACTSITIQNLTFCGNTANQDTTSNVNMGRKHVGIGIQENNVDIHILDNHLCDWSQGIWIGTGPSAGDGNENIKIMRNDIYVQTYYDSTCTGCTPPGGVTAFPRTIGFNGIYVSLTTPGDSLRGLTFSDNTIVDDHVLVVAESHATAPTALPMVIDGHIYASAIEDNYIRVPAPSFTRGAVTISDSLHTLTTFRGKAP